MNERIIMKKSIRSGIIASVMVVLLLAAGATVWAKKGDKIQLKKDAPTQQVSLQSQDVQQPDPFCDMVRMQREMERLFNSMLIPYSGVPEYETAFEQQQQLMDLRENDDAFVVKMDLPGLNKSDISIEIKDRVLSVSGEQKKSTEKKKGEKILMQERSVSSFARDVVLPKDVNVDAVSAEYKAGVLTITLPKAEKEKNIKKINIK